MSDLDRAVHEWSGHATDADTVKFSVSGELVATASKDGTSRVWQLNSVGLTNGTKPSKCIVLPSDDAAQTADKSKRAITMVEFAAADRLLVTAECVTKTKTSPPLVAVVVYDVAPLQHASRQVHRLVCHTREVYVLERHPLDDRLVMSAGYDGRVCIWDIWAGKLVLQMWVSKTPDGRLHSIYDGHFSSDGSSIVVADRCV